MNRSKWTLSAGLYHFGQRYYDPTLGRWTQPDPLNQASDLRQANPYMYVGGDPINNTDPTGTRIDGRRVQGRSGGRSRHRDRPRRCVRLRQGRLHGGRRGVGVSRGPGWRYWLVGLLSGIGFGFLVFLSGDSPVAAAVAGVVWAVAFPVLFRVLSTRVAKRGERDA